MNELVHDRIAFTCTIGAEIGRVFKALTEEIGSWWSHRFTDGSRVAMEPRIGGRFYEEWSGISAALYAVVQYIDPPRLLRLDGPMGMPGAVLGVMEFRLEPADEGTRLSLVHDISGAIEPDTVESYRAGWEELLGVTLRRYCEHGAA